MLRLELRVWVKGGAGGNGGRSALLVFEVIAEDGG